MINIEKARKEDIDLILDVEKSHNIHILSQSTLLEDLSLDNSYYIVAKDNEKIVGYAGITYVIDTADLISIVVNKDNLRRNIASMLLKNIYSFCKENNISKILLEVNENNIIAKKLYLKQGFKPINIRKKYYENKYDAIIMEKEMLLTNS